MARAIARISVERLRRDELLDLRMARRRLQILAHGQEIDVGRAHVVHHLVHFEPLLAEPDHHAGLGEDRGIVPLHALQQAERRIIARARADRRIEPRHRLQIVIVDVRAAPRRSPRPRPPLLLRKSGVRISIVVAGVFRRSAWITFTNWRAPPSGRSSRSTRGDDDMLEAQLGRGDRDMLGLQRIDGARHAGLDVAEGAGPRAGVAQDHHRRVLLRPALADIRAGRLLAYGREVERAHQLAGFGVAVRWSAP